MAAKHAGWRIIIRLAATELSRDVFVSTGWLQLGVEIGGMGAERDVSFFAALINLIAISSAKLAQNT